MIYLKKIFSLIIFNLIIPCLYSQVIEQKWNRPINYNEKLVSKYILPDALTCIDGTKITNIIEWEQKRRPELLHLFTTYMFGKTPERPNKVKWEIINVDKNALGGRAVRKDIRIWLLNHDDNLKLSLQMYLPKEKENISIPFFLGIALLPNYTVAFDPNVNIPDSILIADGKKIKAYERGKMKDFWQVDKILSHGYGLATFCYQDVLIDSSISYQEKIYKHFYRPNQTYPYPNEWGAIAVWAWATRIVMDYLETDRNVDKKKVALIGHSRLGKTALWTAAQDERFAMVFANNTGCGGAAISRRNFGETLEAINARYPHWFCGNFKQFNERENFLPFDQHELIALIAPRPIYIASAETDYWSDQKGEFLGGKYAESVYKLYGLNGISCDKMPPLNVPCMEGSIGYHIRKGKHTMTEFDWDQYLHFADKYFKK